MLGLSESMYLQVKWSGVRTQHSTTPFVDDMYDRLKETLSDYEVIICRWPEYIFGLENVCPDGFLSLNLYFLIWLVISLSFSLFDFVWVFSNIIKIWGSQGPHLNSISQHRQLYFSLNIFSKTPHDLWSHLFSWDGLRPWRELILARTQNMMSWMTVYICLAWSWWDLMFLSLYIAYTAGWVTITFVFIYFVYFCPLSNTSYEPYCLVMGLHNL